MKRFGAFALACLALSLPAYASDKGYCPPLRPFDGRIAKPTPPKPKPGTVYVGTAVLQIVISDSGRVCDARVLQHVNDDADSRALKSVREWKFKPAYRGGRAVPVVAFVEVHFLRNDDGTVVVDSPPENSANSRVTTPQ